MTFITAATTSDKQTHNYMTKRLIFMKHPQHFMFGCGLKKKINNHLDLKMTIKMIIYVPLTLYRHALLVSDDNLFTESFIDDQWQTSWPHLAVISVIPGSLHLFCHHRYKTAQCFLLFKDGYHRTMHRLEALSLLVNWYAPNY